MTFDIAALSPADRPRWEQLWSEYQRFYKVELPEAVTESTWQRLQSGRIRGLGARDSTGALMGIVHFLTHEDTWSLAPACYLEDLYVDSTVRGRGCARQLIEAVAAGAAALGANPPYWLTHETNATARLLYDRVASNLGFIQYLYTPPSAEK
jgi:GNAT superfamily N-acetyltransferase